MLSSVCRKFATKCVVGAHNNNGSTRIAAVLCRTSFPLSPSVATSTSAATTTTTITKTSRSFSTDFVPCPHSQYNVSMTDRYSSSIPMQKRLQSTMANGNKGSGGDGGDYVTVLKLNMLRDNPGAVKEVR